MSEYTLTEAEKEILRKMKQFEAEQAKIPDSEKLPFSSNLAEKWQMEQDTSLAIDARSEEQKKEIDQILGKKTRS